ncbi:iron-containing alcohol dehydrogenase [Mycoplasmatota bacterium zrk1]
MQNFSYFNPTRLIFGKDSEVRLPEEILKYSKRVLLHYGGGSIKRTGLYDKIMKLLSEANIEVIELGGVKPNPVLSMVEEGIRICKEQNVKFILAVGGGSVIDSAKAIAAGALVEHNVWDFYQGKVVTDALPVGVVLTIPAAGSEASPWSVLTKEDGMLKRSFGSAYIFPKFAIMNPVNTFSLPDYQTSCGLSDMLAHMFERYFTNEKNVVFTDYLLKGAIKSVIELGPKLLKDTQDYDLRAEIMLAGTYAHNGSLGVGRIEDWSSHAIEHELSGYNDVAHGAGLSIVFLAWMRYVNKDNVKKFTQLFTQIFCIDPSMSDEEIVLMGINKLEEWYKEIGLPTRLSEIDVPEKVIDSLAKKCVHDRPNPVIGGFKELYESDIINILKLAL